MFGLYKKNPEDFMMHSARLINEQKAAMIIEHLTYDAAEDTHMIDFFTKNSTKEDFNRAVKVNRHMYDCVFTDSKNECDFVTELDTVTDVAVYAKLPKAFSIPAPVGDYNPDWAIAFKQGSVKHVYFIAETKGSLSSMDFRKI